MNLREAPELLDGPAPNPDASRVYGQPYETPDGTTVIPVTKVGGRRRDESHATPLGVFVVKEGKASFVPATDVTRIAIVGILVGLVSATLTGVAMVRRPPWPDITR